MQRVHFHLNRYIIFIIQIFVILLNTRCKNEGNENQNIYTIPIYENLKNRSKEGLKEIVKQISYIKLETSSICLMGRIQYFVGSKDYFFIGDARGIFQFSRNGKFIRNIGTIGRGPGEFIGYRDYAVNENLKRLYLLTNFTDEVLIYDFEGNYLSNIKLSDDTKYRIDCLNDSLLVLQTHPLSYNSLISTEIIDLKGEITFKAKIKTNEKLLSDKSTYQFDNKLFVRDTYNDTIFLVTKEELIPYSVLDIGKSTDQKDNSADELKYSIIPNRILESDRYILIFFSYNQVVCTALYNKETRQTSVTIPNDSYNAGIINNIDNGMNYNVFGLPFTIKSIYNEWTMLIEPVDLLEWCENNTVDGELGTIVTNLKEDDNPIIMLIQPL